MVFFLFNSSLTSLLCHFHLQIHLFDIDIPGKITFIESKTIAAGETPTVVDTGRFVVLLLFKVVVVSVTDI